MIHHKQRLSAQYMVFSLLTSLSASPIGTLYFKHANKRGPESRLGRYWWHFYLINYILNGGLEKESEGYDPITVVDVKEYHFRFYNVCYNLSCLSHLAYEYAIGNLPVMKDMYGIWDMFFSQPFSVEAPERTGTIKNAPLISRFTLLSKHSLRAWRKVTAFFMRFNEKTAEYMEQECEQLLTQGHKVLGVVCRGTDYLILKPKGHPVQPPVDEVISLCRKWMAKYGYDRIYLATEDSKFLNAFELAFPNRILTNKRSYYDKQMEEKGLTVITDVQFDRENDDYFKGLEYLSSINILSKCRALIGGNCGASEMAALLNNENYERMYIFDKGLY